MWLESCDIPDNTFTGLDIVLPDELKDEVISETEWDLLDCFVESLEISSSSDTIEWLFKEIMKGYLRQESRYYDWVSIENINDYLDISLWDLKEINPEEYIKLYNDISKSYILVNGVSINFHNRLYISDFSLEDVVLLYNEWILSRDEAFWILEWEEGFQEDKNIIIDTETWKERWYNLSDALDEFGFSEEFLTSMGEITGRDMDEHAQERLLLMTQFFLKIESRGWYNIMHDTWASSAEWYLQYVHKNGRLRIDRNDENEVTWYEWLTNSFETWLRKIPDSLLTRHDWLWKAEQWSWVYLRMWEWESIEDFELRALWNQNDQSPIALTVEEQLLLTFNDLYSRDSAQEYFTALFDSHDNFSIEQAIIDLYVQEHHAGINTSAWLDDATKRVITETAIDMFWYEDWTVLFSQRSNIRPDIVAPEINEAVDPEFIDGLLNSIEWE